MPIIDLTKSASAYVYKNDVTALSLTGQDIADANARRRPQHQQRGRNETTNNVPISTAPTSADTFPNTKYDKWKKEALCKAIVGRRIKTGKPIGKMYVCSSQHE